jgi:hypothetical protein
MASRTVLEQRPTFLVRRPLGGGLEPSLIHRGLPVYRNRSVILARFCNVTGSIARRNKVACYVATWLNATHFGGANFR